LISCLRVWSVLLYSGWNPSLVLVLSFGGDVLEFGCKYRRHGMSPFTRDVSVTPYLDVYLISTRNKVSQ
jgi:hypothetical protein